MILLQTILSIIVVVCVFRPKTKRNVTTLCVLSGILSVLNIIDSDYLFALIWLICSVIYYYMLDKKNYIE
jgi:hypothetical protein